MGWVVNVDLGFSLSLSLSLMHTHNIHTHVHRYGYVRLDGSMSIKKLQKIVDKFNDPTVSELATACMCVCVCVCGAYVHVVKMVPLF